jgi:hypothetical protein
MLFIGVSCGGPSEGSADGGLRRDHPPGAKTRGLMRRARAGTGRTGFVAIKSRLGLR